MRIFYDNCSIEDLEHEFEEESTELLCLTDVQRQERNITNRSRK